MKRVGILSGTFDPIHDGHLALAKQALSKGRIDSMYLLPECNPRHKPSASPFGHRLQMCKLAVDKEKRISVLELEDERFTISQSLPKIKALVPGSELVMILGSDVFVRLPHWPDVALLTEEVKFIVAARHTHDEAAIEDAALEAGAEFMIIQNDHPLVSSSEIRSSYKKHRELLHPEVMGYISQHNLYA